MSGYDAMGMGVLIIVFTGIVGLTVLNFILAEVGRNSVGNYWLWILAFYVLPLISHIIFIVLLIRYYRKVRARRVAKSLVSDTKRIGRIGQSVPVETSEGISVTPFDSVEESMDVDLGSSGEIRDAMSEIPEYLRDKKVEELIDWCKWGQARIHVADKIKSAEACEDKVMIRIYEIYRDAIRTHSDHEN